MVDAALHLPSLSIQNFRGISDLTIERLGRVTLIAGRNGIGKTTLLDAVRVYADRGNYITLIDVLQSHDELRVAIGEEGEDVAAPDFSGLFHNRKPTDAGLSIGAVDQARQLRIQAGPGLMRQRDLFEEDIASDEELPLKIKFAGVEQETSIQSLKRAYRRMRGRLLSFERGRLLSFGSDTTIGIRCQSTGPHVLGNEDIARFWDAAVSNNEDSRAVEALRLIYGDGVERVNMVADYIRAGARISTRRAVVNIEGQTPVPLRSLGDGAIRMYGVALALASSKEGVLLIDEAENGLHHAVQSDFWKMVIQTAQENDVQVLATTHSWDCVAGFARALTELEEVEGALIRLDRMGDQMRAVEYTREDLQVVSHQGIEVR